MNLKSHISKVGLLAAVFLLGTTAFAQQTKTVDWGGHQRQAEQHIYGRNDVARRHRWNRSADAHP